jgi:hypothetical protein
MSAREPETIASPPSPSLPSTAAPTARWTITGEDVLALVVWGAAGATLSRCVAHCIRGHELYEAFARGSVLVTDLRTMEASERLVFAASERLRMVATLADAMFFLTELDNIGEAKLYGLRLDGSPSAARLLVASAPLGSALRSNDDGSTLFLVHSDGATAQAFASDATPLDDVAASPGDGSDPRVVTLPLRASLGDDRGTLGGRRVQRRHSALEVEDPRAPSGWRRSEASAITSIAITDDGQWIALVEGARRARILSATTLATEREVTFDEDHRVLRFCEGDQSVAFAGGPTESKLVLWSRGRSEAELDTVYETPHDATDGRERRSIIEVNETASRWILEYPAADKRDVRFACVERSSLREEPLEHGGAIVSTARFETPDIVAIYLGINTCVYRPLDASASLSNVAKGLSDYWRAMTVHHHGESRGALPSTAFDWWSKGSKWHDVQDIAASPAAVLVASHPAIVGLYTARHGRLSTITRQGSRLARVTQVAIAKDHPRFVVALDSGEVLICEFAA